VHACVTASVLILFRITAKNKPMPYLMSASSTHVKRKTNTSIFVRFISSYTIVEIASYIVEKKPVAQNDSVN
jgi:hypothetical protein